MTLILLTLLYLLGASSGKLAVETDPSPITAKAGDDVALKCVFKVVSPPVDLSQLVVQWFYHGGPLVEFDEEVTSTRPGATLSLEGLRYGNASLLLSKVSSRDTGNYRCYITYAPDVRIKQVALKVEDPTQLPSEPKGACPSTVDAQLLQKMDRIIHALEQIVGKLDHPGPPS
ncbi:V-set domain-containing T-cell activation inhibitor 1-like [Alligator mississippiensis]|uniref:V-set domain-containing T-cell activation inhibitor 1-like n=1 Tax=Alligator mississippiensis TaxID=8496 RepID=A0A151MVY5_ALLMI|nr:V-set domain-containing T-cell activation inhibitor 1-like [Alligator mississippiensis]